MISFLQPLALFGLAAAAIPPLLHLISRRVPPVIQFPSVRYLTETERKHSRRLKLRHLLLLLMRTLLIALIALAASRPIARIPLGSAHEPSDIAIVLDNSLSSGAVVEGATILQSLVDRVNRILDQTGSTDRVWLTLADAIPQRMSVPEVRGLIDTITPWPIRLDLSEAARVSARAMEDRGRSQEVVVLSDIQASAFGPPIGELSVRVLVWGDSPRLVSNRSLDSVWTEPVVWSPEGQVVGAVGGSANAPATIQLTSGSLNLARAFGAPGELVLLPASIQPGWHAAAVDLDPDELRADDTRYLALVAAAPANVTASPRLGLFVADVVEALRVAGRVGAGPRVIMDDRLTSGATVLFPPEDPSLVGALNRELAGRGIGWRLGDLISGEWLVSGDSAAGTDVAVSRRRRLEGQGGGVLLTAGGEPWLVKDREVVLVASRMEPAWTSLPLTASFAPFVDWLMNRVSSRQVTILSAEPGGVVSLPAGIDVIAGANGLEMSVGEGSGIAPVDPGVYFLRTVAGDTVGALEVNPDPRESQLEPATPRSVSGALGSTAEIVDDGELDREIFSGARRADLTGLLAVLAIVLALSELLVATVGGGRSSEG